METTSSSTFGQQLQASQMLSIARQRLDAGDPMAALTALDSLPQALAYESQVLGMTGEAHTLLGQLEQARAVLAKAIKAQPDNPAWHCIMATTFQREGRFVESRRCFDAALKLNPDAPMIVSAKATMQMAAGDFEAAHHTLRPLLEQRVRDLNVALAFARLCRKMKQERQGIAMLNEGLAAADLPAVTRADALFHLGHLNDDLGEYDLAFKAFDAANALRGARFDPESFSHVIDELIWKWSPPRIGQVPVSRVTSEKPVFIVGMPRSGTSLVEQILSSHPQVYGAGERADIFNLVHEWQGAVGGAIAALTNVQALTQQSLNKCASGYLARLERLAPRARRITDKMPQNFLHLGLISRLFPGSRVIHCVREPMDTCLSCYTHNFGGALPFAYNLSHLGLFYREYQRVMQHWHSVLDLPILDISYEDLATNQDAVSRRMVEFIGLPWDDACLRFNENKRVVLTLSKDQVRRPMYKSAIGRHHHYAKHLAPLRAALEGRIEN